MALSTQNDPGSVAIAAPTNPWRSHHRPGQCGMRRRCAGQAGSSRNAECKVLNAQAGAPAERFCESECLTTLGYVCTQEFPG
jgi:hypothetical protein